MKSHPGRFEIVRRWVRASIAAGSQQEVGFAGERIEKHRIGAAGRGVVLVSRHIREVVERIPLDSVRSGSNPSAADVVDA